MSVTEVIAAVRAMTPEEREQVRALIDSMANEQADAETQALASLEKAGLLRRPSPRRNSAPERAAIEIKGKPLSETIIEERR